MAIQKKVRIKKPAVMKVIADEPVQEVTETLNEPQPPIVKPLTKPVTKLVRQPNVELAIDPILAALIRSYDEENAALKRQYEENNRAKKRAIDKVLAMNAVQLRQNASPSWVGGTDVLSVPVPDVVAQVPQEVTES